MNYNLINIKLWNQVYNYIIFIKKYKSNNKNKHSIILEPFTTIVKLCIISFKKIGTKLAFINNKVYIQSPNISQGIQRWAYGNNREEIHHLLKPILKALFIYDPKNSNYKIIYEFVIKGLKLLKKSYDESSSTLCHALDLYINIIKDSMLDNNNDALNKELKIKLKNNLNISENTEISVYKCFNNIWCNDEINLIKNMLLLADKTNNKRSYIHAIESILNTKEKKINKIIKNTNLIFL